METRPCHGKDEKCPTMKSAEVKAQREAKYKARWNCKDCGLINPQWFWVSQSVWEEAGLKLYNDGIFCLACFAKRLNRPMTLNDFDDNGPCSNDAIKFMYNVGVREGLK